jgi:dipeptidyl aminopeptidase/acylaminoacyl peptidase
LGRCRSIRALATGLCPVLLATAAALGAELRDHTIVPEDYFEIATVYAVEVSPDGRLAAWVESRWGEGKEGRRNDLWVVDVKEGGRRRLTFDGFGAAQPRWSPDGDWIFLLGRMDRSEDAPPYDGTRQVWRVSPAGGAPQPLTRADKGVADYDLAPDGAAIYYTVSEQVYDEEWRDLRQEFGDLEYGHGVTDKHVIRELDLENWREREVRGANDVIHELRISPDGTRLGLIVTDDEETIFKEGWSRVTVLDLASGQTEIVTPQEWRADHPSPFGWLENLAWAADGRALAFTIAYDGYPTRIYLAEWLDGALQLQLVARPGRVDCSGGLRWKGKGRTLCYLGEELARVRVIAVEGVAEGRQGDSRELVEGDVVVGAYGFSADGKSLVAAWETPTTLNDLHLVKKPDRHERLTDLNPQVATWKLPRIEHVSWTGADGEECWGILELPPDYRPEDGPLPFVVELHGGPKASTQYRLRLWIYGRALLPAEGYGLLSPNYHGSTGYGDEFLTALIGRENEIEVTDILAGLDAMIDRGLADPARVGVMGWSNGGYLTNCLITAAPERFRAASSGAGVVDMVIQWGIEDTPGHVINYMEGNLPWQNYEHYIKASPLYLLDRVRTPTLIHVGGADPRVPVAHSRTLYRALRHYLQVPVELVVYPGEGHGLSTHENRLAKMKWDLAWFRRHLLGETEDSE